MTDERADMDFMSMFNISRIVDLNATTKDEALREMVKVISKSPDVADPGEFEKAIFERERQLSTGVGIGVAIPHVKIESVKNFVAAVGRSHRGIEFNSIDNKPVHLIVMIGANDQQSGDYLKILAKLVLRLKNKDFRRKVLLAKNLEQIKELFISKFDGE